MSDDFPERALEDLVVLKVLRAGLVHRAAAKALKVGVLDADACRCGQKARPA